MYMYLEFVLNTRYLFFSLSIQQNFKRCRATRMIITTLNMHIMTEPHNEGTTSHNNKPHNERTTAYNNKPHNERTTAYNNRTT